MTIYDRLQPLEPFLSGPWTWVTHAVIAAGLALAVWATCSRRWRPDGVRRCVRCRHPFDPNAAFGDGLRCSECGQVTSSERDALRRRGRGWAVGSGVALALVAAIPLGLWNAVHLWVARSVLSRWVVVESATFADGLTVVLEGDPLQAWLGWEPNPWSDAVWDGMFFEWIEGSDPPVRLGWPQPWRMTVRGVAGSNVLHSDTVGFVRPMFGAAGEQSMPSVGSPGFGDALAPGGACTVVIGQPNPGSGGGVEWHEIRIVQGMPTVVPIGWGWWERSDASGAWTFERRCHGFRYEVVPGVHLSDWDVTCSWDAADGSWRPDPALMRRPVRADILAELAREAEAGFRQCVERGMELGDDGVVFDARRGTGGFLPCPEMVGAVARGAIEHVFTGNAGAWRAWVESAWPPEAGVPLRAAFMARMQRMVDECECADVLRALNAPVEAVAPAGREVPGEASVP
ncbi:MAG: hypothetical protein FGM39_09295 [Phycisphaerales bacterium]|nr:hypothetical protein [Phycisphaerales bacterium]